MQTFSLSVRRLSVAAFALVQVAFAASSSLPSSPFLSAPVVVLATRAAGPQLEFRGVMADGDRLLFRVVDPTQQTGFWVRLNEPEPALNFVVTRYDPSSRTDEPVGRRTREAITVEQAGRAFRLELCGAKLAAARGPGSTLSNVSPDIINTVKLNPTPADEKLRLEAIIAEVNRLREERERSRK